MNRRRFLIGGGSAGAISLAAGRSTASPEPEIGQIRNTSIGPDLGNDASVKTVFADGDPRQFGALGNGVDDDSGAVQKSFNILNQGVLEPNPRLVFSFGQYKISNPLDVPNSASQFEVVSNTRPRSTQLLWAGPRETPVLRLVNSREALFSGIGIDKVGPSAASHCVLQNREDSTQIGTGGVGHIQYRDCRFAGARIGVEIAQEGSNTNDNNAFFRCEIANNTDCGLYLSNTNAAWTDIDECRFYNNGAADVSNVVLVGKRRGGSFTARQCRHVLGDIAYEIGASRSISIIAPRIEQQSCFMRTSACIHNARTIAASTELGGFIDASGSLPTVSPGDRIWVRGFKNSANNGVFTVVRRLDGGRIQVAEKLASEADGRDVQLAPTKVSRRLHKRGVHVMVFGGEIHTNGPISLLFDGDSSNHVLTMVNCDYQAANGHFEFPGAATVNFIGGTYGVAEMRFNGRLNLIGTIQAARKIRLVNLGRGELRSTDNVGINLDSIIN